MPALKMKRKFTDDGIGNEFDAYSKPTKSTKCAHGLIIDASQQSAASSPSQETHQNDALPTVEDGTNTSIPAETFDFQDTCTESSTNLLKAVPSAEESCNMEVFLPPNYMQSDAHLNFISYGNGDADADADSELHCLIDVNSNQGTWESSQTCSLLDIISLDNDFPLSFDSLIGLLTDFSTLHSPYIPLDTLINTTERCMTVPCLGDNVEVGTCFDQVAPSGENTCFSNSEVLEWLNKHLVVEDLPDLTEASAAICPVWLPKAQQRKKTLVLDLDETLVHSTLEPSDDADFTIPVFFEMKDHTVYVRQRPFLHTFLQKVSEMFEVVIFTASQSIYASKLLDVLDPGRKLISQRIYRESCIFSDGNCTKDLTILGVDLANIAIIDNTPQVFRLQVNNGIPIKSWFDDRSDNALLRLLPFLETLVDAEDVRPVIAEKFGNKGY